MDGVAFNSKSILESVDSFVNLADFTGTGTLDGSNINSALQAAKDVSNCYYIPKGLYNAPAIMIDWDCYILCDREAVFDRTTDTAHAAMYFESCSVHLSGGTFRSGVFDPITSTPGRRYCTQGLIHCLNVSNCIFENIVVPYSDSSTALRVNNSRNITIQNCEFNNCLIAGVIFAQVINTTNPLCTKEIADNSYNFTVRNCRFNNMLRATDNNHSYCYAVFTGLSGNLKELNDTHTTWESVMDASIRPMKGLVYDNNYVNGSEDCGLDTHGASNVQISNNIVLNTVCAITAYNDNNREPRPLDWNMENITIFNNYCYSEKQNLAEAVARNLQHPFIFLGASNVGRGGNLTEINKWEDLCRYDNFMNCKVYNNTFITANDYQNQRSYTAAAWFYLDQGSRNVEITNNYLETLPQPNGNYLTRVLSCYRTQNVKIENNKHVGGKNTNSSGVITGFSGNIILNGTIGTYKNNQGFILQYSNFFYLEGVDGSQLGQKVPNLAKYGDKIWRNKPLFCVSYGLRYSIFDFTTTPYTASAYPLPHTVEIVNNIAESKYIDESTGNTEYFYHRLVGNMLNIKITNVESGVSTNVYVNKVISNTKFEICKAFDAEVTDEPFNGTYNVEIRPATLVALNNNYLVDATKLPVFNFVPATITHAGTLRQTPSSSGVGLGSYSVGDVVLVNTQPSNSTSSYTYGYCMINGALKAGYIYTTYFTYNTDPV